MKKQQLKKAVAQIENLYIAYSNRYLEQKKKAYITHKAKKSKQGKVIIPSLNSQHIEEHLKRNKTYGVLLDNKTGLTKFMTFDVDIADDLNEALLVTKNLYKLLTDYYGLDKEDVHVSFSGGKGYHIDLFFNEVIDYKSLLPFYEEVLKTLNETKKRIEFRPSGAGVKLPLGINQKTGNYCYFVDPDTFSPVDDGISYLLSIKQMDYQEFKEFVLDDIEGNTTSFTLDLDEGKEFIELASQLNLEGKSLDEINQELTEVLQEGRLIFPDSRHRISWLLPTFFNTQGYEEEEACRQTLSVIINTYDNYKGFIDMNKSREYVIAEVRRLTKLVYKEGYTISNQRKEIEVSKAEVKQMLEVKKLHLKKLLFSLLIQSKRHAKQDGSFYMAYSVIERMGNTDNRTRALLYLQELEQLGHIEIVSRGVIDNERTKAENTVRYKPNEYRVTLKEAETVEDKATIKIKATNELRLENIVPLFVPESEAKKKLPRKQWEHTFKKAYI